MLTSPRPLTHAFAATLSLGIAACGGTTDAATSSAPTASAATVSPSGASKPASSWGAFPKAARRNSAPPGIFERALKEGAIAPDFELKGPSGAFSLDEGLHKATYVVLVFYRGAW